MSKQSASKKLPLVHLKKNFFFFCCGSYLKSLLNLLQYCFMFLDFWLQGTGDHSSLTRDRTHTSYIGRWNLNHWTNRELPLYFRDNKDHSQQCMKGNNVASIYSERRRDIEKECGRNGEGGEEIRCFWNHCILGIFQLGLTFVRADMGPKRMTLLCQVCTIF